MAAIRILEYLDAEGRSPYGAWFDGLNAPAAAKVAAALYQLAAGNRSNVKGVGSGVFERKIDTRSEEHTSELQSRLHLVCRLLLGKKKKENGDRLGLLHAS